ncbi:MAG: hypothetical protein EBZ51_11270 [Synechococcaceae bacterium WB9_2_112]|jgi:N-acyl-D-aspartate/D-glutamate deacylase|nr:hypothetical protein [Synechococcaceae bacterium WB9_2_112]
MTRLDPTAAEALGLVAAVVELVARELLVPLVALVLTLAGWRPAAAAAVAVAPVRLLPPAGAALGLDAMPVRQLRQLARAAGHRGLARNGRRADLLAVLAA